MIKQLNQDNPPPKNQDKKTHKTEIKQPNKCGDKTNLERLTGIMFLYILLKTALLFMDSLNITVKLNGFDI